MPLFKRQGNTDLRTPSPPVGLWSDLSQINRAKDPVYGKKKKKKKKTFQIKTLGREMKGSLSMPEFGR